jgi:hypothetical protein
MIVTDTYCRTCFAVVPGHHLGDHMEAAHGKAKAE